MRSIILFAASMLTLLLSSPAFALVSLHIGAKTVTFSQIHLGLLVFGLLFLSSIFAYRYIKAK